MIVIVEGPDGAGKTHLAMTLERQHHFLYRHEGPPPAGVDVLEHYLSILHHYRGANIVFDRFALGERVYGPVLRDHDGLGDVGWAIFRAQLQKVDAKTVLCLPSYDVCFSSWASGRTELFHEVNVFNETYRRWTALAASPATNAIDHIYDYTRHPLPELHP